MKTNRQMILTLVGIGAALLGGCDSAPEDKPSKAAPLPEVEKSLDYYRTHLDEARAKVKACRDLSKAEREANGNCTRAISVVQEDKPSKPAPLPMVQLNKPSETSAPTQD